MASIYGQFGHKVLQTARGYWGLDAYAVLLDLTLCLLISFYHCPLRQNIHAMTDKYRCHRYQRA